MGKRDIQHVYSLNANEHKAFQSYWEGNSVPQIGAELKMSTSQAGKVLDKARVNVRSTMTEKAIAHGELSETSFLAHNGTETKDTKES